MSDKSKSIVYEDDEVIVLEKYDPAQHIFNDEINLWVVKYTALFYGEFYRFCSNELIDALYDMIVKLKEEGVI